jgi:hypothetical protein
MTGRRGIESVADILEDSRWKCHPSTSTGYNRGSTKDVSTLLNPSQ